MAAPSAGSTAQSGHMRGPLTQPWRAGPRPAATALGSAIETLRHFGDHENIDVRVVRIVKVARVIPN